MPEISRFFGITIRMYFDEHEPPHFHAVYSGTEAVVDIGSPHVTEGNLPGRAASMVVEWAWLHRSELLENWEALRSGRPAQKVPPLR